MSARNPLQIVKSYIYAARTKAYGLKKLRDAEDIAEYCTKEVWDLDVVSPKLKRECFKAWVRDLCTSRIEQADFEKPDLFHDLDFHHVVRRGGRSEEVAHGDVGLVEMDIITRQKKNNIDAASTELARWERACSIVRPLLVKHPKWKWRDAVKYLGKHGGIPDID